jgi:hypothetical protein
MHGTTTIFSDFLRLQERYANDQELVKQYMTELSRANDYQRQIWIAKHFTGKYNSFVDGLIKATNQSKRFAGVMLSFGWPPPGDIPAIFIRDILDAVDAEVLTKDNVDEFITSYYTPEIVKRIGCTWMTKPFLGRRHHLLHMAINGHCDGNYVSSILIILTQIEGFVAEVFGHKGQLKGAERNHYFRQLLMEKYAGTLEWDHAINKLLLNVIFAIFRHGDPIPTLSRHAIIHGADVDYASEANSLKLILLFDRLQSAYDASR